MIFLKRISLDNVYLEMLETMALRSTCVRRQVAAIVTDRKGRVISTGYNGVPQGMPHCIDLPCKGARDRPGDTDNCLAVHAEANALLQAGSRLAEAHTIYCSCFPCFSCAKLIANTEIKRVVFREHYPDDRGMMILRHLFPEYIPR